MGQSARDLLPCLHAFDIAFGFLGDAHVFDHGIELSHEEGDLIVSADLDFGVEIAVGDGPCGLDECRDSPCHGHGDAQRQGQDEDQNEHGDEGEHGLINPRDTRIVRIFHGVNRAMEVSAFAQFFVALAGLTVDGKKGDEFNAMGMFDGDGVARRRCGGQRDAAVLVVGFVDGMRHEHGYLREFGCVGRFCPPDRRAMKRNRNADRMEFERRGVDRRTGRLDEGDFVDVEPDIKNMVIRLHHLFKHGLECRAKLGVIADILCAVDSVVVEERVGAQGENFFVETDAIGLGLHPCPIDFGHAVDAFEGFGLEFLVERGDVVERHVHGDHRDDGHQKERQQKF